MTVILFFGPCDNTLELELLYIHRLRKLLNVILMGKADGLDGIPSWLVKLSDSK